MRPQVKTTLLITLVRPQYLLGLENTLHRNQNEHHIFDQKANNKKASNQFVAEENHDDSNSLKDTNQSYRNNNRNKLDGKASKVDNNKRWNKNTFKNKGATPSNDVPEKIINDETPTWKQKNLNTSKQQVLSISSAKRIPSNDIDKYISKVVMIILFVCYLIPACIFFLWLLLQLLRVIRRIFFMSKSLDGFDISVSLESSGSLSSISDRGKDLL